jgi:hypothetical protein
MRRPRALAILGVALVAYATGTASPRAGASPAPNVPVPSLEPAATATLWNRLVHRPRRAHARADCRPLRGVFYAATDWLRLATKLAAAPSPCASYYVSIPPIVGDKTNLRPDQASKIRALGPSFHALAEIHWASWSRWVASTGSTWYEAGVEARRRMAKAGFDVAAGDTWAVNEFPSTVRTGVGPARANARELVRGLYNGADGSHAKGVVFIVGVGQSTSPVTTYQTNLQNWLADTAFWTDMRAYVSDWSQEVYGDYRRYAVPDAPVTTRRDYLDDYLQHTLVVTRAGPPTIDPARSFMPEAFSPVANAAWQWESGYGWTSVPEDQMQAYVSAQVYALRFFSVAAGLPSDHWGFAWQPRNGSGLSSQEFGAQTGAILDRLAAAIRDSADTGDPSDPGSGACGPPGENVYCGGDYPGGQFTELWKSFRAWSEPVLAFTTASQTLTAGQPSGTATIELQTSAGLPQVATVPTAVTLDSSSLQGSFSLSPDGPWAGTLTTVIPAGSSDTPPFYYLDSRAARPQLVATAFGSTTATQVQTVLAGPLAVIHLDPPAVALDPHRSQRFAVLGADRFGNPVSAQATWAVAPTRLGTVVPETGSQTTFRATGRGGLGRLVATARAPAGQISGRARLKVSPGPIRVSSIRYVPRKRVLRVTATAAEVGGPPASGVRASVVVRRNGRRYFAAQKRTDRSGRATYLVPLSNGCYTTTVTGLSAPGYRWTGKNPRNRFCT